jgi:hypothetical protein
MVELTKIEVGAFLDDGRFSFFTPATSVKTLNLERGTRWR